jgi:riboflavin kinase/FMN adenylyltransferase
MSGMTEPDVGVPARRGSRRGLRDVERPTGDSLSAVVQGQVSSLIPSNYHPHPEPFVTAGLLSGVIYRRSAAGSREGSSVVTIGQFDGVHRGHQALIADALARASATDALTGAVTFDRHPISVLDPDRQPRTLCDLEDKVAHLLAYGLDYVAVLRVDSALLATEATQFVDDLLVNQLAIEAVVVGPNFRFGKCAMGDPGHLAAVGVSREFDVVCPALTVYEEAPVSSTRIRRAIALGDMAGAAAMLGRPYAVAGVVEAVGPRRATITVSPQAALPVSGRFVASLRGESGGRHAIDPPIAVNVRGRRLLAHTRRGKSTPVFPGEGVVLTFRTQHPIRSARAVPPRLVRTATAQRRGIT